MFKFETPKALIVKINPKRVIPLLFLTILFFFASAGITMAKSQQDFQTGATIDDYSGSGTAKGVGLWILFTLAISYGLNNHLRKRENKPENTKS
jgi:hypothetical protein